MSQYRDQILQAQRNAAVINLLKKNNYLAGVNSADVAIAASADIPTIGSMFSPVLT